MVISNCEITKQDSEILRSCVMDKNSQEYKKTRQFYTGVDLTATDVYSAYQGTVVLIGKDEHGQNVIVQTGSSFCINYSHMTNIDVRAGQQISARDRLGLANKYVHVELLQSAQSYWPVRISSATWYKHDPQPIFDKTLQTANVANITNMNVTILSGTIVDSKPSDELTDEVKFMLSNNGGADD